MDSRIDPEMRSVKERQDALASAHPPVVTTGDLAANRAVSEKLNLVWTKGGPTMARTEERWLPIRGRRVLCRMHRPNTAETLPVLVWFHGGGWVFSSIDTHDRLVREYAAAGQVATVSVDYALSPEAKFPQALLECADVVRSLSAHAAEWGIDPQRILLGGDSAGGNLALGAALLLRASGGPALRGVLTAYPVTAADFTTPSYTEFAEGFGLTRAGMQAYWQLYTRDVADTRNPLAAPLLADMAGLPPVLVQVAELDVLYEDGARLAEKLRAAGVDVTFEVCRGVLHGFMRLSGEVSAARDAIARAGTWLARITA